MENAIRSKQSSEFHVPKGILYITIPQHILGFCLALYFILIQKVSFYWLWLTYASWVLLGVVGIGIFYHKYFAHKSFETYSWVEAIGGYLGVLAGLGPPIGWVALHNDHHHKYADQSALDVHSPAHGKFTSYMGWQFKKFDLRMDSAKRLLKKPWLRYLGNYYFQIYWLTASLLFLINPMLPVFVLFLPGCIHYHVEGIISCFCHIRKFGYRNFETNDNSVNILWLGILTWGAAFHNNHHKNVRAAHYQEKAYEIDLSRLLLILIPKKRLVVNEALIRKDLPDSLG